VQAVIHYMDDFLFMEASNTSECSQALAITIDRYEELGLPLAEDKTKGLSHKVSN